MRELSFPVSEEHDGANLKSFLRGPCRISVGILKRLKLVENGITVNGVHATVRYIVRSGDLVRLRMPRSNTQVDPEPFELDVLLEDHDLLILNKPSQMPIYPTPGHDRDSLANAASYRAQTRGETFSFHPIYRLDKNTSGLVVLAKNAYAASLLAFGVEKKYYAICEGHLTGSGTIDLPIRRKEGHAIQREVGEGGDSQSAVTHWKALRHTERFTLLEIKLQTGRTHQIRVHFSHLGYPLAGDDLYGGSRELISRQALHCGKVNLTHPVTGEPLELTQPLPDDMMQLLKEE